jgi:hypothetical protein
MIYGIHSNSQWVEVGPANSLPYVADATGPMRGIVRCVSNRYEVWDGHAWVSTGSMVSIDLSHQSKQVMVWAYAKMNEEARMQSLAKQHPAVAEALMLVRHAEERLQVVVSLTKDNNV